MCPTATGRTRVLSQPAQRARLAVPLPGLSTPRPGGKESAMINVEFPELPRLTPDEGTGMAGMVFSGAQSPMRALGIVSVKVGGTMYGCLVYPDLTALGWLAHPSISDWLATEVPKLPKGKKLRVWWLYGNPKAADMLAAEVDRLGLPRHRGIRRY